MSQWPLSIDVQVNIGTKMYYHFDNNEGSYTDHPCCAVGHLRHAFGCHNRGYLISYSNYLRWQDLYKKIYHILMPVIVKDLRKKSRAFNKLVMYDSASVETVNDALPKKWRKIMYLLTWAKLGYTHDMPSDVWQFLKYLEKLEVKE